MRVGIVGSRKYQPVELMGRILDRLLDEYGEGLVIVSGGEPSGVDALAASMAQNRGISVVEHLPLKKERKYYFARNTLIVKGSQMLIALYADGPLSPGTTDTVMKAQGQIPVYVHHEGVWTHN